MFRDGDVYEWVDSPAAPHMYVVVSVPEVHEGCSTFMGALISSRQFERDPHKPTCVKLEPGEIDAIVRPSLVYCEQVTSVPVTLLGKYPRRLGTLSRRMPEIIGKIGHAMGATCWRDPHEMPEL